MERERQCRQALSDILTALHMPYLISLPEAIDFGLGSFSDARFFACMSRLRISPEPSLLCGSDECSQDSFFFCLCEYRDVLRIHRDHEHLLESELAKAADDPAYVLPKVETLYDYPTLNDFAAAAACLTWSEGPGGYDHYSSTWYSPKFSQRRIWWLSEIQWRYQTEEG
jgi:hypothetical protein